MDSNMSDRMYLFPSSPMFDGLESVIKTPSRSSFMSPSVLGSSIKNLHSEHDSLISSQPLDLSSRKLGDIFSPIRLSTDALTPRGTMPYLSPIPTLQPYASPYKKQTPGTSVDPRCNSVYLKRLHNNPMFSELQSLLAQECLHMQVPTNLINTSWSNTASSLGKPVDSINDVFPRHMKLQEKFIQLRTDESYRHDGLRLESEYSSEVGKLEVARYQALCAAGTSDIQRKSANDHFDQKRLSLLRKYERELENVILKKDKSNSIVNHGVIERYKPDFDLHGIESLTAYSSELKETKHKNGTVARQLDYPNEVKCKNHPKLSSSVQEIDYDISDSASPPDYLQTDISEASDENEDSSFKSTRSNLCDSGVCDDTYSEHSDSSADILQHENDLSTITNRDELPPLMSTSDSALRSAGLHPMDINRHEVIYQQGTRLYSHDTGLKLNEFCSNIYYENETASMPKSLKRKCDSSESCSDPDTKRQCGDRTIRGNNRQLNTEQTVILTTWYNEHIRYPYPSDLEVEQLSESTGLQPKQVKKWMANKRVRCFNTLSISGNQHPIKFKFKGNRHGDNNGQLKPIYQQLNPEARKHLNEWYESHIYNPYPTDEEKEMLAKQAGVTPAQVKSWFANKRSRSNNTRRQVPNYFINKFPEYVPQVQMISLTREIARKSKRQLIDTATDYLYRF